MNKLIGMIAGIALAGMSAVAGAWEGGAVYTQVSVNPQEQRVVEGYNYYGRNPTQNKVWTTLIIGEMVYLVPMRFEGIPGEWTDVTWETLAGTPEGKWIDALMVISEDTRWARAWIEKESETSLVVYMYWCRPGSKTVDTYTPLDLKAEGKRYWQPDRLYTKSSKQVETGCYVPSRQYIRLEKIN